MTTPTPRLAVICVDGGTARYARKFGLFHSPAGRPVVPLRSVYPSSTAPAHASILTGRLPAQHGIVGNRYWNGESVEEIRRQQDPLQALHPYDRASLRHPSILDEILDAGLSVGAVLFPHTFSRSLRDPRLESCYCLYAPASTWKASPGNGEPGRITIPCFGENIVLSVDPITELGGAIRVTCAGRHWDLRRGEQTDVVVQVDQEKAISFALSLDDVTPREVVFAQGTAVLVLATGAWPAAQWLQGGATAHSRTVEYTASPGHDFHESPSVEWVTESAMRLMAEEPDALFIRYNQADHAQEYLYWEAVRGEKENAALARHQIEVVYRRIAAGVEKICAGAGPDCIVIVLSDHGIDYVDTQVAPNYVLGELGLLEDFIFQGDSNVCYLYGNRPLTSRETMDMEQLIDATGLEKLRVLSPSGLSARGALCANRCGILALETAPHAEFCYHEDRLIERVRSASHGFDPRWPTMHGMWQVLRGPHLRTPPAAVTGVADFLRTALAEGQ
jgi:hypothetical protein